MSTVLKRWKNILANMKSETHTEINIDRVIEMAWEDRTPFDAIKFQFNLSEQEVIEIMRTHLKQSSFKRWRKRVQGRITKHLKKRTFTMGNFKCTLQRTITSNRISKKN